MTAAPSRERGGSAEMLAGAGSRARGRGALLPLAVPAAVAIAFLLLPLAGLLVRAPWRSLPSLLADPLVRKALQLSLLSASLATGISLLIGVPLAWVLARVRFHGGSVPPSDPAAPPSHAPPSHAPPSVLTALLRSGDVRPGRMVQVHPVRGGDQPA